MSYITKYTPIVVGIFLLLLFGYIYYLSNALDSTRTKLDTANQKIDSLNTYIEKTNHQLKAIQHLDADYQEKLRNAHTENDKLRDSLANNVKRVYVKANCPMPTHTTTTSGINATTVRLAEDARQDYLRLRLEIEQTKQQVLGLQHYIQSVCLSY